MKYYFFTILFILNACNNSHDNIAAVASINKINYQLVKNWPQLPQGFVLGDVTGIGIDTSQNIFAFHRSYTEWPLISSLPDTFITSKTILAINRTSGKLINSWGANLFIMPHGLTVDKDNNIWVTDVVLNQVFKFAHDGTLLMKLGVARVAGNDSTHFKLPTDVAVTNDGSFYVSDGYGNSRVVKFSASGKYLFQWGTKGNKPGEFNIPHSISLDKNGNVYVADRENNRVQAFDSTGKFLKEYKDKSFGYLYAANFDTTSGQLLAVDYVINLGIPKGSDVIIFDSVGKIQNRFGRSRLYDGPVCRYHDIAVDKEGNIYVGDILDNHIQKFERVGQ
ncbi:peptidyl-alpha-hydroxyglycine alpha-amidating lyase family protein [soil metagenome]